MKALLLATGFLLGMLTINAQSSFRFIGITIGEDLGCINKVNTKTEVLYLPDDTAFESKRKALQADLKELYRYNFDMRILKLQAGKKLFIALAAKTRKCTGKKAVSPEVISYSFYYSDSEEGIQRQADMDKRLYSDLTKIEIVNYIQWEKDIADMLKGNKNPEGVDMVKDQKSRVKDNFGKGQFGAPRDKGTRKHQGLDIVSTAGEAVQSPIDGVVVRETMPYKNDASYKGVLIKGTGKWTGYNVKIFYVEGLFSGQVKAGEAIGTSQNLTTKYPGITNHVHIEVRKFNELVDPFELWQYSF